MRKAIASAADSSAGNLRAIPSVERILSSPAVAALIRQYGREGVKSALGSYLNEVRASRVPYDEAHALAAIDQRAATSSETTLRRVINGTGIIIHTNLGRSPIDPAIWTEAAATVAAYSNLEFDLGSGERGIRDDHLVDVCRTLFGCEAAILANNNAAGTLLLLAAVAAKKEVLVSRGELVEIGGAFRVPDVIQQGGAKLVEVGTTNRTRASDYSDAASRRSAAILRVHRSNFDIVGFTETPPVAELVEVARAKKLPLLYDEGSGRVVELSRYGFSRGETIRELFALGVDAITCSTDKLIGATQGGLILGSENIVNRCRKHPLMRALRAGKESYAVIGATLRAFATERYEQLIPIYRMLATPIEQLRQRAEELTRGTRSTIIETRCALGGGTTPSETIASISVTVPGNANEIKDRFLRLPIPIAGRIAEDAFTIDVRTLMDADMRPVREALN